MLPRLARTMANVGDMATIPRRLVSIAVAGSVRCQTCRVDVVDGDADHVFDLSTGTRYCTACCPDPELIGPSDALVDQYCDAANPHTWLPDRRRSSNALSDLDNALSWWLGRAAKRRECVGRGEVARPQITESIGDGTHGEYALYHKRRCDNQGQYLSYLGWLCPECAEITHPPRGVLGIKLREADRADWVAMRLRLLVEGWIYVARCRMDLARLFVQPCPPRSVLPPGINTRRDVLHRLPWYDWQYGRAVDTSLAYRVIGAGLPDPRRESVRNTTAWQAETGFRAGSVLHSGKPRDKNGVDLTEGDLVVVNAGHPAGLPGGMAILTTVKALFYDTDRVCWRAVVLYGAVEVAISCYDLEKRAAFLRKG